MPIFRRAVVSDLPAITEIYNEAIRNTISTMDTVEKTVEERRAWFEEHGDSHPIIVCEEKGKVVGWASLNRWSDRIAYQTTAEGSVFIDANCRGQGIGKRLVQEVLAAGKVAGLHHIVARISTENKISLKMCRDAGFEDVGIMREAGRKFDRWIDITVLQYIYK